MCFTVTIAVSLATKPRPDEELTGLVYALTPKPTEEAAFWQRPGTLAVVVLIGTLLLNLIFF